SCRPPSTRAPNLSRSAGIPRPRVARHSCPATLTSSLNPSCHRTVAEAACRLAQPGLDEVNGETVQDQEIGGGVHDSSSLAGAAGTGPLAKSRFTVLVKALLTARFS